MQKSLDYLIIGQGLAGSLLGWQLMQYQQRIVIVDPGGNSASRVAAGLINPVTGKRLVKTQGIETYLPTARQTYHALEHYFGSRFWHQRRLVRLFQSEADIQSWKKRKNDPAYRAYLAERFSAGNSGWHLQDTHGGFRQKHCAYLDTAALLDQLRDYFREHKVLSEQRLSFDQLNPDQVPIHWKELRIQRVIFCEGWHAIHNPWFSWLPFQAAKGDILTLQSAAGLPDEIIHRKQWLIPTMAHRFRLGTSYQWNALGAPPQTDDRNTLLSALNNLFIHAPDYTLLQHQTGIRPGSRSRQPFLGQHPEYPNLYVFNGFGSKGVLLIPWFTQRFCKHLLQQEPLPSGCDTHDLYTTAQSGRVSP